MYKYIKDLQQDYASFGQSIQGLSTLETGISKQLQGFADVTEKYQQAMKEMVILLLLLLNQKKKRFVGYIIIH